MTATSWFPRTTSGASSADEQRPQQGLTTRVGDEVSGDADDVRLALRDPAHRAPARAVAARERSAEVEVGEVPDPQSVQDRRKAGDRDVDDAAPQPAGLEPPIGDQPDSEAGNDDSDDQHPGTLETSRQPEQGAIMGTGLTGLGGRVTSLWLMAVLAVVAASRRRISSSRSVSAASAPRSTSSAATACPISSRRSFSRSPRRGQSPWPDASAVVGAPSRHHSAVCSRCSCWPTSHTTARTSRVSGGDGDRARGRRRCPSGFSSLSPADGGPGPGRSCRYSSCAARSSSPRSTTSTQDGSSEPAATRSPSTRSSSRRASSSSAGRSWRSRSGTRRSGGGEVAPEPATARASRARAASRRRAA